MKVSERYKRRGFGRRLLLIALVSVLGGVFLFGQRGLIQWYRLWRISETMEARNDSLEVEIEAISARIQALEAGDSLELERIARRCGMVKPGEEVYIIQEEGDSLNSQP